MSKTSQRVGVLMLIIATVMLFSTFLTTSFATADIGTNRLAPQMANPVLIKEGFEGAGIATAGDGWVAQDAPGSAATWLPSSILAHEGNQSAVVKYPDNGLEPVNTWLLSPAFTLDGKGVVNFTTFGHKNICVEIDWCDLEVWLVKGSTLGDSDDISLGLVDPEWTGIFSKTHHSRVIPAGLGEIRVGFHYSSTDGAAVYVDAVEIRDLTADVMYEADVQGENELTPVVSPITTTASFAYNFSTHVLTTSADITSNGELLLALRLYAGTSTMTGTAIHDYGIPLGATHVTHTSSISLTADQELALIRGGLFIRPIYLQGGVIPVSGGCGQLVQKLSIEMGFEAGVVPPDGWEMQDGVSGASSAATWVITSTEPNEGSYSAVVPYPGNDNEVGTWLISPPFELDGKGIVEFASAVTVFYCRDNNDNCDLEVWAIKGNEAGDSGDVKLGLADPDWPALPKEFEWTNHKMEIPAGLGPIRIGFLLRADKEIGGDKVYLDSIQIREETLVYLPLIVR